MQAYYFTHTPHRLNTTSHEHVGHIFERPTPLHTVTHRYTKSLKYTMVHTLTQTKQNKPHAHNHTNRHLTTHTHAHVCEYVHLQYHWTTSCTLSTDVLYPVASIVGHDIQQYDWRPDSQMEGIKRFRDCMFVRLNFSWQGWNQPCAPTYYHKNCSRTQQNIVPDGWRRQSRRKEHIWRENCGENFAWNGHWRASWYRHNTHRTTHVSIMLAVYSVLPFLCSLWMRWCGVAWMRINMCYMISWGHARNLLSYPCTRSHNPNICIQRTYCCLSTCANAVTACTQIHGCGCRVWQGSTQVRRWWIRGKRHCSCCHWPKDKRSGILQIAAWQIHGGIRG